MSNETERGTRKDADRLEKLIDARDRAGIEKLLDEVESAEGHLLALLPEERAAEAVALIGEDEATTVLEEIPEMQAAGLLGELEPAKAAALLAALPSEVQTDLVRNMPSDEADPILGEMASTKSESLSAKRDLEDGCALLLLDTEIITVRADEYLADVLTGLRERTVALSDHQAQYLYVVDAKGRLSGVLPLRELVVGRERQKVSERMAKKPVTVDSKEDLEGLENHFDQVPFLALPVVDEQQTLLGVVHRSGVEEALSRRNRDDFLSSRGIVGGEELRNMPLATRCRRRLSWLVPNIILNLLAATVIARYEETLEAVIALAIFLPIVSDMSGCSGNQAVAVSIRELTLDLVRPRDYLRVLRKEVLLGLINGTVLGMLVGSVAWMWKGNIWLGLVIGAALALNTVLSVSLGGLVPLLLKRFKVDPALASGPLLTTCTDMAGFFLVLSLAGTVLHRIL